MPALRKLQIRLPVTGLRYKNGVQLVAVVNFKSGETVYASDLYSDNYQFESDLLIQVNPGGGDSVSIFNCFLFFMNCEE